MWSLHVQRDYSLTDVRYFYVRRRTNDVPTDARDTPHSKMRFHSRGSRTGCRRCKCLQIERVREPEVQIRFQSSPVNGAIAEKGIVELYASLRACI